MLLVEFVSLSRQTVEVSWMRQQTTDFDTALTIATPIALPPLLRGRDVPSTPHAISLTSRDAAPYNSEHGLGR